MDKIREIADRGMGKYIDDEFFEQSGEVTLDGDFTLDDLTELVAELGKR